jgi:hypothetical protein
VGGFHFAQAQRNQATKEACLLDGVAGHAPNGEENPLGAKQNVRRGFRRTFTSRESLTQ